MTTVFLLALSASLLQGAHDPVDFDTDVLPVLTKAGCNAGACHGGAAGRGGFKLSLFGSDPAADFAAVVRELEGRRVNPSAPEDSLLVLKPTNLVDHEGGVRLDPLGPDVELVEEWIRQGARRLESRALVALEVTPEHHVARAAGASVELRAVARFDDGSRRDVTRWTVFTAEDPGHLALEPGEEDPGSLSARVLRGGQSVVVARYLSEVRSVRVTAPVGGEPVTIPPSARANLVDDHVNALLATLRIAPAPAAGDAAFLRRARLALTGTLPSLAERRQFLAEEGELDRAALVDRLMASEDFVEYWTFRLSKLLRLDAGPGDVEAVRAYRHWLRRQVEEARPFDDLARDLITASGDSHVHGAATFHRTATNAREEAELVSEAFLGARLRCANCHGHPLDRWTQDDYHGLAAVFARIERGRVVEVDELGEVTHPVTGEPAVPRLPGERFLDAGRDCRGELAEWLVSPDNPYFARNVVNRLWQAIMGRGLVEPVDDLRATNPASHPELLDALAADLAAHDFDVRRTIRLIATSATFGRASRDAAPHEHAFYASVQPRALEPEVLADAIAEVTGVAERYGDEPLGTRAIALSNPGAASDTLDLLGRCSAPKGCSSAGGGGGLAARLHLLNGELLNARIEAPEGRLATELGRGRPDAVILRDLYERALCRPPGPDEVAYWQAALAGTGAAHERKRILEDFLWSLLSCREFNTNH